MILATFPPNLPRPTVENVFPERPVARSVSQRPVLTFKSSLARHRAMPRINATACWVVESGPLFFLVCALVEPVRPSPGAPVTGILSALAAFMSIPRLRDAVVRRSFRFGSCLRSSAGKGVLSLMVEMTTNGFSLSTNSFLTVSGVEGLL